jgi:hypothetical protein
MILVKATKESEAGVMPPEKLIAEMQKYHEELVGRSPRPRSWSPATPSST